MRQRAFVIGGAGQIGRALAPALVSAGWEVTVGHRGQRAVPEVLRRPGITFHQLDRDGPDGLSSLRDLRPDVVIDTVAYDQEHADQLLRLQDRIGAIIAISSISVYCDDRGRSLESAGTEDPPQLPDPIPETHLTVAAGPETYSTKKIALENRLVGGSRIPVTILRPGAIYGPGALHPREWWFVRRVLDGRRRIPLAFSGNSRFSATSVRNLTALILACLEKPATRVLNAVDPETITVYDRGEAMLDHMGADCELVRLGPQPATQPPGPWGTDRLKTTGRGSCRWSTGSCRRKPKVIGGSTSRRSLSTTRSTMTRRTQLSGSSKLLWSLL